MTLVSTIFTSNHDLCMPILSSDTNCCVDRQATRSICGIRNEAQAKHEESQHTQGINVVRPFAYVHGKGGVFSASSQKEVHDTMLLDLFYSSRVHESL